MKVIEHIKPKGECTLKVKVSLMDRQLGFQVLEQKRRDYSRKWSDIGGFSVESYGHHRTL